MSLALNSVFKPLAAVPHPASAVSKAATAPTKQAARPKPPAPASAWGAEVHRYLTFMKNGGGSRSQTLLQGLIENFARGLSVKSEKDYLASEASSTDTLRNVDTLLFSAAMGSGKFRAEPLSINPQWISSLRSFAGALRKKYPKRENGAQALEKIANMLEQANGEAPLMAALVDQVLLNKKTKGSNALATVIKRSETNSSIDLIPGFHQFLTSLTGSRWRP
jgi:hypothetical protein